MGKRNSKQSVKKSTTRVVIPEVAGSEAAYQRFLPLAARLEKQELVVMKADPILAHHNAVLGVTALLGEKERIGEELPAVRLTYIEELPELLLAVAFAARQVNRALPSNGELQKLLQDVAPLRELLLTVAEGLAKAGILPTHEVVRIRQGRGNLDLAQDAVDLAALFRKYAALVMGKSAVTSAQVTRAAELGSALLRRLRPASARPSTVHRQEVLAAAEARDRLWTLALRRHLEARRIGGWLFGEDRDKLVPRLRSRTGKRGKAKTDSTAPDSTITGQATEPTAPTQTAA